MRLMMSVMAICAACVAMMTMSSMRRKKMMSGSRKHRGMMLRPRHR